jgi:hypothetical protein
MSAAFGHSACGKQSKDANDDLTPNNNIVCPSTNLPVSSKRFNDCLSVDKFIARSVKWREDCAWPTMLTLTKRKASNTNQSKASKSNTTTTTHRWSMVDVLGSSSNNHRRPQQHCYPILTYSTATTTAITIIGNHVGGRSIR